LNAAAWTVRFNCPHCSQHLAVDKSGAGMTVNCPSCNQPIEIPRSATQSPPSPPAPPLANAAKQTPPAARGKLIKCRDCGHAISSKATSCPTCRAPVKRTNPVPVLIGVVILFAFVVMGSLVLNNSSSSHYNVQTPSAQDAPFEIEKRISTWTVSRLQRHLQRHTCRHGKPWTRSSTIHCNPLR
jgi:transcription elongation factor Elf1